MKRTVMYKAGRRLIPILFCLLLPLGCYQKAAPEKTASATLHVSPTPAPTPTPLPLSGLVIGIDPGHQAKPDYSREPIAPGSKKTKAKVSSGTRGLVSKVYEYEVNLKVGLKLRAILEGYGATVVLTRETNDVNISNSERAKLFNEHQTDYAIRLHCNGKKDTLVHGAFVLIPKENPFLDDCKKAAKLLIDAYCEKTGEQNHGVVPRDDQTGFNFCNRLILNIEMGYLSNAEEEQNLISDSYQNLMAEGIAAGILRFFGK